MDFKAFVCSAFKCSEGLVPANELIAARAATQKALDAQQVLQSQVGSLENRIAFLGKTDALKLAQIKELESTLENAENDRDKAKSMVSSLQKLVPEQETIITKTMLGEAVLKNDYVFHTARPVYLKGAWRAQHFDVRRFYFPGDSSITAVCRLICDEYKPSTPQEAMLAVFKWQATNVQYMTDDEKWREGDNWGYPCEVLLTDPGTYPVDESYYDLLKAGKLTRWYYDDCESKSHLTKALCTNMKYVDEKLAVPDEWLWVAYGMWSGFGHSWVVYWDTTTSVARIYEATASTPPFGLQSGYPRNSPSYDEYFFNNATYVAVNKGKQVLFG